MEVSWGALAVALTIVGGLLSWAAWRRRGVAAGLRGLAWSLLPVAAWLTGTLRLLGDVAGDVSRWALHLVFSPIVWTGVALAGVSGVLFVVSGFLQRREPPTVKQVEGRPAQRKSTARPAAKSDEVEGMDEVEVILKKYGI